MVRWLGNSVPIAGAGHLLGVEEGVHLFALAQTKRGTYSLAPPTTHERGHKERLRDDHSTATVLTLLVGRQ